MDHNSQADKLWCGLNTKPNEISEAAPSSSAVVPSDLVPDRLTLLSVWLIDSERKYKRLSCLLRNIVPQYSLLELPLPESCDLYFHISVCSKERVTHTS